MIELKRFVEQYAIIKSRVDRKLYTGSGGNFDWLFSFHDFFVSPRSMREYARSFCDKFGDMERLQIGGLETSGIPLVLAILFESERRGLGFEGFFIRKERKQRGLCDFIDGNLSDAPIVVVDDVFKSGASMDRARLAIKSHGKNLTHAHTIVDFDWDLGRAWSAQHDVGVTSFFKLEDFALGQNEFQSKDDRRESSGV